MQGSAAPAAARDDAPGSPIRILIVEDSPEDTELLVRHLRRAGHEVSWERVETAEAMGSALARGGWDVIVSDHRLPRFSSTEALALLKERGLDIPFIIVSGSIGEDLAVEAMRSGAGDYILKSNLKRLAAAVDRELREARGRRARREAERRGFAAEERYRTLVEQIPAVTFLATADASGGMLYVSPQIEALLGSPPEAWTADPLLWRKRIHPEDRERVEAEYRESIAKGAPFASQCRFLHRDGRVVWARIDARASAEAGTTSPVLRGFVIDVTESVQAEETIRHLAFHDRLTGLPNRALLEHALAETLQEARRAGDPLALVLLNLDRFTEINNTLGHRNGDGILREAAARLRAALGDRGTLARLGGDVFAAIIPGADAEGAAETARGLLEVLRGPFVVETLAIDVEARVGIALFPGHAEEADLLLQRADAAVHAAKMEGGDLALYAPQRDPHDPRRLVLMAELRKAIESGGLFLQFQPKVGVANRSVEGFEALVRWRHPAQGIIPPARFLPLAEQGGLIKPLTRWVLGQALRRLRAWSGSRPGLTVAVNLSARNLQDPQLPDQVGALLATWGVDPAAIEIEITESAFMSDVPRASENIERLHRSGIRIAIDDFGTGYSSLGYLRRIPASTMKIDKSFVAPMETSPKDQTIVRSTINLAHDLGLTAVAEGVETAGTMEILAAMGCDVAQGYHIARPLDEEAADRWLREGPYAPVERAPDPSKRGTAAA